MKKYKELTFWENLYRQKTLTGYQEKVEEYFQLVEYDYGRNIIDNSKSKVIRTYLNKSKETIQRYLGGAGISPNVTHIGAPVGGSVRQRLNLLDDLFNLQNYDIETQALVDFIDQALGVYERDFKPSLIRTVNPLFWVGKILEILASIPFYLLGRIGFDQEKLELSFVGKVIKLVLKAVTIFVLVWGLLVIVGVISQDSTLLQLISRK